MSFGNSMFSSKVKGKDGGLDKVPLAGSGRMWHEARKQEKKIKGMMVDYKKRAERRREYYEKIKLDPTQFLQVHGRPCKVHLDPAIAAAAENPVNMMPWQGQGDNLIDRFDGRAHLDLIPEYRSKPENAPVTENTPVEERHTNYERYRIIVQNFFLAISEEKFLHQLYLEEQFGSSRNKEKEEEKKKLSEKKAAIGYVYEDCTGSTPIPSNEGESHEDDEDSDEDFDLNIDVSQLSISQSHEINECSVHFGMFGTDFLSYLTKDLEEQEALKLAKEQEEEKGKKSRRERRAFRERQLLGRKLSPPSYAAPESPSLNQEGASAMPLSHSSSRSPTPTNSGQITYITSFGGEESETETAENKKIPESSNTEKTLAKPGRKTSIEISGTPALITSTAAAVTTSTKAKSHSRSRSISRSSHHRYSSEKRRRERSVSNFKYTERDRREEFRDRSTYYRGQPSSRSRYRRYRSRSRHRSRSRSNSKDRYTRRNRRSISRSRRHSTSRDRKCSVSRDKRLSASRDRKSSISRERNHSNSRDRKHSISRDQKRSTSRDRKRSTSQDRKRSTSQDRRHSSSRDRRYQYHKTSHSPNRHESSRLRQRSQSKSSHSTPTPVHPAKSNSVESRSSKISSKSSKSTTAKNLPSPPIKRYYGCRQDDSGSDVAMNEEDFGANDSSMVTSTNTTVPISKPSSAGLGKCGASTKVTINSAKERLMKKMQAAINKQFKADKKAEKIRLVKQEQERLDREDELRLMAMKLRKREREKRHRMQGDEDDSEFESSFNSDKEGSSSTSVSSRSPSPTPIRIEKPPTRYVQHKPPLVSSGGNSWSSSRDHSSNYKERTFHPRPPLSHLPIRSAPSFPPPPPPPGSEEDFRSYNYHNSKSSNRDRDYRCNDRDFSHSYESSLDTRHARSSRSDYSKESKRLVDY